MEQDTPLGLLQSFKNQTIEDVEYIEGDIESLIKITFTNKESFIIAGDNIDMYLGIPRDMEIH